MSESSFGVLPDLVVVHNRNEVADEDEAEYKLENESFDSVLLHSFIFGSEGVPESDPCTEEDREDESQFALGFVFGFHSVSPGFAFLCEKWHFSLNFNF